LKKKKENICLYSLQPGHSEAEQSDRKVQRSKIKMKGVKKKEFLVQTYSSCAYHHRSVAECSRLEKTVIIKTISPFSFLLKWFRE